jgi:DNA polymerase-3 subunit alpha (Gram-positive type)
MINAFHTEFVVFDVETTGLSPLNGDRIIEIAAVKVKDQNVAGTFCSLVNPGRAIPIEAQRVHGITPEMVADAPPAETVLPQMIDFIGGGCLVGHNIKFDLDFLCYELALSGRKLRAETPAVDTLKMSKKVMSHLRSHRLSYLAHSFGVRVNEAHRALADVNLTVSVLYHLLDIAVDQGIRGPGEILKHFSVPKPNFKIENTHHELFS